MKLHSKLRIISIICYLFIFLEGMFVPIPFILVLTLGVLDQEPAGTFFLLLTDLGLVTLVVLRFMKRARLRIALECIIYFMLLAPLVRVLVIFPLTTFAYALFWVPFAGFAILYPLSIITNPP